MYFSSTGRILKSLPKYAPAKESHLLGNLSYTFNTTWVSYDRSSLVMGISSSLGVVPNASHISKYCSLPTPAPDSLTYLSSFSISLPISSSES